MNPARRALAARPATLAPRRLLLPRPPPARPALGLCPARPRGGARAAATTTPARRYSVAGARRVWTFDEVRRLVEARSRGGPAGGEQEVVVVDVREPEELRATGKIPGAVNIPLKTQAAALQGLDGDELARRGLGSPAPPRAGAHLVFYCRAGVRARAAAELARRAGWPSLGEYPGSWLEWEERGGPVERVPADP